MKNHTCRTYFRIIGHFDVDFVVGMLRIQPYEVVNEGDELPVTKKRAGWDEIVIGYNDKYDVDINEMLRVTIKELASQIDFLTALKRELDLEYYLVVVPEIYSNSEAPRPILSLDRDIIDFMYKTGTEHDLDYYIYQS